MKLAGKLSHSTRSGSLYNTILHKNIRCTLLFTKLIEKNNEINEEK